MRRSVCAAAALGVALAAKIAAVDAQRPASTLSVAAADGSIAVTIDAATGRLTSLAASAARAGARTFALADGGTDVEGAAGAPTVSARPDGSVVVERSLAAAGGRGAFIAEVYSPAATSVHVAVRVTGNASTPWTAPVTATLAFAAGAAGLRIWSPWDRGSATHSRFVDPLSPSDGHDGWWDGEYFLGAPCGADSIVAAHVTVLDGPADAGVSFVGAPTDSPRETRLALDAAGAWRLRRLHARLNASVTQTFDADIVAHGGDLRGGLAWSVAAWPSFWEPVNAAVYATIGTGSYSSFLGDTNATFRAMDYATSWDLSGRFFPYAGMFLPPVAPGDDWMNDIEGSQAPDNITFAHIDEYYARLGGQGVATYSYANNHEFGLNVHVSPPTDDEAARGAPAPAAVVAPVDPRAPGAAAWWLARVDEALAGAAAAPPDWHNASNYVDAFLRPALFMDVFDSCSASREAGPIGTWQDGVVLDAGLSPWREHIVAQMLRRLLRLPHFIGVIIDRSDWQRVYNLRADDGLSTVDGTGAPAASNSLVTSAALTADLRASLGVGRAVRAALAAAGLDAAALPAAPLAGAAAAAAARGVAAALAAAGAAAPALAGAGLMLANTLGTARLDATAGLGGAGYDGSFSEGYAWAEVGLLGLRAPAVLWTYDEGDCCTSDAAAAAFFGPRLYTGAIPMSPFPLNDHSIGFPNTPATVAYFTAFGPLFAALAPRVWALIERLAAVAAGSPAPALVNAFVAPLDAAAPPAALEQVLLLSVAMAGTARGTVTLNLTGVDRAWSGATAATHPLLARAGAAPAPPAAGASVVYVVEALAPGAGGWAPLLNATTPSFVVPAVPLALNCSLVRVRRVVA